MKIIHFCMIIAKFWWKSQQGIYIPRTARAELAVKNVIVGSAGMHFFTSSQKKLWSRELINSKANLSNPGCNIYGEHSKFLVLY